MKTGPTLFVFLAVLLVNMATPRSLPTSIPTSTSSTIEIELTASRKASPTSLEYAVVSSKPTLLQNITESKDDKISIAATTADGPISIQNFLIVLSILIAVVCIVGWGYLLCLHIESKPGKKLLKKKARKLQQQIELQEQSGGKDGLEV